MQKERQDNIVKYTFDQEDRKKLGIYEYILRGSERVYPDGTKPEEGQEGDGREIFIIRLNLVLNSEAIIKIDKIVKKQGLVL